MLEIINFFKKINIFTQAVEEALRIKQDIDHIDDKEFIYIDFNETTSQMKLSFKDIEENHDVDKNISFNQIYKFLSIHFKYYPYNIVLNGSFIPKDYDPFFKSYSFGSPANDSNDSNTKIIQELTTLYEKEFNMSFNKDKTSIIYFIESYPYRVKTVFYIDTEIDEHTTSMNTIDDNNFLDIKSYYYDNFKVYNSSILYNDNNFSFIPDFLYKILGHSPSIKLIINIEGIDSNDQFKSENIKNFLTKKLADLISSKIKIDLATAGSVSTIQNSLKYWNRFSYFIKQAVILDPLFFSKIKDYLLIELKNPEISYLNINDFLKNKDQYKYSTKYKLNINPTYSHLEYDYINFLTDQIGSSILLDLL